LLDKLPKAFFKLTCSELANHGLLSGFQIGETQASLQFLKTSEPLDSLQLPNGRTTGLSSAFKLVYTVEKLPPTGNLFLVS
jgi:hypothetical protein